MTPMPRQSASIGSKTLLDERPRACGLPSGMTPRW